MSGVRGAEERAVELYENPPVHRVSKSVLAVLVLLGAATAPGLGAGQPLFETGFDDPAALEEWILEPADAFAIVDSNDPEHGPVLELRPRTARTHALIRGSDGWGEAGRSRYRIEGRVLFPTDDQNYLGFIYNLERRPDGRIDLGSLYIKGNGSYIRANPRRDWNPARMLYEEYRTELVGAAAIVIGEWQSFALEVDGTDAHLFVGDLDTPQTTFELYEGAHGLAGFKPRVVGGPVWIDDLRVTAIEGLSYRGPRRPAGIEHRPETVVTDWRVLGPLQRAHPDMETSGEERAVDEGGRTVEWRPFATDARGAVVTGRVVDFLGPDAVAYFRTDVAVDERSWLELSSIDDFAIWVNGEFRGYGYADRFAWHDLATNPDHRSSDRVTLEPGATP